MNNDWRAVWNYRVKITLATSKASAIKWVEKHRPEYGQELKVDEHPKDGWVVYYQIDAKHPVPLGIRLNFECVENDLDIHRMFTEGATIPSIVDELYLRCSIQAVQRYVSERRKFEPTRWPYRRQPA